MEDRREEWEEDGVQKKGVGGRWSTEKRSGRKIEYRKKEWEEDGVQKRGWRKEDGAQKRGVEGRWRTEERSGGRYSSEKRSARKTRSGNEIEYNRKSGGKI